MCPTITAAWIFTVWCNRSARIVTPIKVPNPSASYMNVNMNVHLTSSDDPEESDQQSIWKRLVERRMPSVAGQFSGSHTEIPE